MGGNGAPPPWHDPAACTDAARSAPTAFHVYIDIPRSWLIRRAACISCSWAILLWISSSRSRTASGPAPAAPRWAASSRCGVDRRVDWKPIGVLTR